MSELFDSLNLSNSAGPSSSQQSSSQPSTSKVFWHASPSPGVLRQLHNWTPSKSQDSPTLPLCTQAFVGELRKLPGALEAQSPLISRNSANKRKLIEGRNGGFDGANTGSNSATSRGKTREVIALDFSDDDDDESGAGNAPRRLLLGDAGDSSPESRRRRTMDAGHTGRVREPSSPSEFSSTTRGAHLEQDSYQSSSHRRLDRRPSRRRKKESFIAGLGFTDESGRASDTLKLFEDLQAAIQGMQGSRPPTSGSDNGSTPTRPTVTFDRGSTENGGRLTPREGINRTTSAPTPSRAVHRQDTPPPSSQHEPKGEELQPRRTFRPVKSDHDVFRAAAGHQTDHSTARALQPRPINLPSESHPEKHSEAIKLQAGEPEAVEPPPHTWARKEGYRSDRCVPALEVAKPAPVPAPVPEAPAPVATKQPEDRHAAQKATTTNNAASNAQASPVKRSARIEAMQQTSNTTGKKLGVRGPSMLSKPASSPRKPVTSTSATRKVGGTTARTRTHPLPGMSQARQVGLPRSSSQFLPSQSQHHQQQQGQGLGQSGPAAPFRPPAISRVGVVKATSPVKVVTAAEDGVGRGKRGAQQPAFSDDSFPDDDEAFLALACELEY